MRKVIAKAGLCPRRCLGRGTFGCVWQVDAGRRVLPSVSALLVALRTQDPSPRALKIALSTKQTFAEAEMQFLAPWQ